MSNFLKKSIETFRVAPVAVSRMTLASSGLIADAKVLAHNPEVYQAAPIPVLLASIAIGGLKIAKQRRLKQRLENSIEEYGFNERIFDVTTVAWCARQTARVVCKDSGHLAEYEALCEKENAGRQTWLPHIP